MQQSSMKQARESTEAVASVLSFFPWLRGHGSTGLIFSALACLAHSEQSVQYKS